jgi:hypothetical protein
MCHENQSNNLANSQQDLNCVMTFCQIAASCANMLSQNQQEFFYFTIQHPKHACKSGEGEDVLRHLFQFSFLIQQFVLKS